MLNLKWLKQKLKKSTFDDSILGFIFNPYYIMRSNLHRAIKKLSLSAKGNVLDFGCGAKPYKSLFPNADKYVGCDIEVSGHSHMASQVDVFYDGKTLPFENDEYDWVVSFETFEHIFNLDEIIKEIARVVKPGGKVLVSAPFCWDEHETPYDFARYTSFGLTHLLEKQGLEVVEYVKTGSYILAITQIFTAYLNQHVFPKSKRVKVLLVPMIIMPIHLIGIIMDFVLPTKKDFFLGSVVLCEKKSIKT